MNKLIIIILLGIPFWSHGQIGGDYTYDFLSLPSSARETMLGGALIAVRNQDAALAYSNPALLSDTMDNRITFNHNFHFAGISNGYASYVKHLVSTDITLHGGFKYLNYGTFSRADIFGNQEGTFKASDVAFHLGAGKNLNERFSIGLNLKLVRSQLDIYQSTGLASDIGLLYHVAENGLSIGLVLKNAGSEIGSFTEDRDLAPIDLQIGISKKLKYIPFRFSVTAHSLQRWQLRYTSSIGQETDIFGNPIVSSRLSQEVDNFFRHLIFSGELLLGRNKNFSIGIGYNHQRRRELQVSTFRSLGGFSFGFGIQLSKFRLAYGVGNYHLAGAANHLSVSFDLDHFFKKAI